MRLFFTGGLAASPRDPCSRVRPRCDVTAQPCVNGGGMSWCCRVSGIISAKCSFRPSSIYKASGTQEWRNKSFAGLRHNWGIAAHCLRNSLYPKPLIFLLSINVEPWQKIFFVIHQKRWRTKETFCHNWTCLTPPPRPDITRPRNIAPGRTRLRGFRGRSQPPEKSADSLLENVIIAGR